MGGGMGNGVWQDGNLTTVVQTMFVIPCINNQYSLYNSKVVVKLAVYFGDLVELQA
jgi:hypothetical protein